MQEINEDFNVPYYIFKEIVEYIELTAKGCCKCMKWSNVEALLNLAVVNERLSKKQVEHIKQEFCREQS
ncbi:MAG: hypothetical protein LBL91_02415 [Lachnospiraceae bacterium]|jgi:hypothetical protein|nr:hypothetical protein [Lachnospiraceae bacterium]